MVTFWLANGVLQSIVVVGQQSNRFLGLPRLDILRPQTSSLIPRRPRFRPPPQANGEHNVSTPMLKL